MFDENKVIIIPKLIPIEFCHFLTHVLIRQHDYQIKNGDHQIPNAYAILDHDVMFETIQERVWPKIETTLGEELLPTYSYARLYSNKDELIQHSDRPACEISVTIQLGRSHHYSWPIYMGGKRVDLGEGDAVIYNGCKTEHWREPCNGPDNYYSGQVFIHFVRKNGEHVDHYNDTLIDNKRYKVSYIRNRTYEMEIK